jgi:hypothetical protein
MTMRRVSIKAKRITGMLPIERPVRAVRALFSTIIVSHGII